MRQIDADIVIKELTAMKKVYDAIDLDWMIKGLQKAETITLDDLRPHGLWEMANNRRKSDIRRYSACKEEACFCGTGCSYNYCPNCSAKMDGSEEGGKRG